MRAVAFVAVLATAGTAQAQPFDSAAAQKRFERAVEAEIGGPIGAARQTAVAGGQASASAQALEEGEPTSAIDKASAAIKTDLENVEAGIQVAPLALGGNGSPGARAWTVMVAAVDGGQFRVGTAYRRDLTDTFIGLGDLAGCKIDWDQRKKELLDVADDVVELCRIAHLAIPPVPAAAERVQWLNMAGACGLSAGASDAEQPFVDAGTYATASERLTIAREYVSKVVSTFPAGLAAEIAAANLADGKIAAVSAAAPSRASCLDADSVARAVTRARWDEKEHVLGVALTADFFPIVKGLNVDPSTERPSGELAQVSVEAEFRRSVRRVSWAVGLGGKLAREAAADDLEGAASGSLHLDVVVARLDGKPLLDADRKIALTEDHKLPPLLSLGIDLTSTIPLDPSDDQETQFAGIAFDAATITPFVDLRFNDDLAIRVGAPLKAEAQTRESDNKRGLVWTVPVFVTTVLKL